MGKCKMRTEVFADVFANQSQNDLRLLQNACFAVCEGTICGLFRDVLEAFLLIGLRPSAYRTAMTP